MKKIIKMLTLTLCFTLGFTHLSFAYENGDHHELGESVSVEGELSYETNIGIDCIVCGIPKPSITVISGPTKVKRFVRYLTGSWAKASSYTWSKSQTASATLSSDVGVSAGFISSSIRVASSVTTTYSVAITVPADSRRFSKLAFYSDYDRRYVKVKYTANPAKYTYHYAPRKDTYLQVIYQ